MPEHDEKQNATQQSEIRQIVEHAVAASFQAQIPQLQTKIVEQVLEALPAKGNETPASAREDAGTLVHAVSSIHAGSTQKEILRSLLDAAREYGTRIALFVVKAGAATGWQSRGFGEEEAVKDFSLDLTAGPVAHTYQNRIATPGNIAEMGRHFAEQFGSPANEQVLVLPLLLKDKVAALVYADGGDGGKFDPAALELLVMATSSWLEVTSLRKQVAAKEDMAVTSRVESVPPPVQTVSSFSDPFAAHAPKHVPASVVAEHEPAAEVVEVASGHAASAAAAPAVAADPWAGMSPEDADVHRKAQRFARLLVDEIKLYNQAKVAEGRRNKDLYDRLKEDIDKSRGTFNKRYGSTVAASGDYFYHELLRSLAEDDVSIMGSNFHR
ncbi:MAG: GAF domain-containing protein [Candidatus Sulfotelmatobacter sp.]